MLAGLAPSLPKNIVAGCHGVVGNRAVVAGGFDSNGEGYEDDEDYDDVYLLDEGGGGWKVVDGMRL